MHGALSESESPKVARERSAGILAAYDRVPFSTGDVFTFRPARTVVRPRSLGQPPGSNGRFGASLTTS